MTLVSRNLVPSELTMSVRRTLKCHFEQKIENTAWLGKIVCAINNDHTNTDNCFAGFPYTIKQTSVVTEIIKNEFEAIHLNQLNPRPIDSYCVYLIAMPCTPGQIMRSKGVNIQDVINKIEEESFGTTSAESLGALRGRVCMVIGLNTFYSIDSNRNQKFREYVSGLESSLSARALSVKIVPFFWSPWKPLKSVPRPKSLFKVDKCYTLVKSYLMLERILNRDTEKRVSVLDEYLKMSENFGEDREHPLSSIIPYQAIRTTILHSRELRDYSNFFNQILPDHHQSVVSLDADFVSLKTDQTGLLSHYNNIIDEHYRLREKMPRMFSF